MCKKTSKEVRQVLLLDVFLRSLFLCKFGAVAYEVTTYSKRSAQALGVAVGLAVAVACWGRKRLFIHNGVIAPGGERKRTITTRYVNIAWGSLWLARWLQLFVFCS